MRKSSSAEPSFRNSGQETYAKPPLPLSRNSRWIAAPVPTGTVDFITSAWRSEAGIDATTACTAREVGIARVGGRCSDGDEQQPRMLERGRQLGREVQPLAVARDALRQPGLVDRDLVAVEPSDLLGVDVHAPDVAAELGETGRRDEADVAGPDDRDRFALRRLIDGRRVRRRVLSGRYGASARPRSQPSACCRSSR